MCGAFGKGMDLSGRKQYLGAWGVVILLVALVLVYWPGLHGPFLLDDFDNLGPLGDRGGIHGLRDALRFVFGNNSGPLGRPLAMGSFLLNAQSWPADPWAFKVTNLGIHLLNTVLLFAWLSLLLRPSIASGGWRWLPLWATAVWAFHPLQVSAVLYVIQRMALMSCTFVFAGLLIYTWARLRTGCSLLQRYLWMTAALGVGLGLGCLCKENAILFPLFVLAMEATLLSPVARPPHFRSWSLPLFGLPLLALVVWLASDIPAMREGVVFRGYSWFQHVLTEPRVLMHYLAAIFWPDFRYMGLFHDDIPLSVSWVQPVTALLSVAAIAGALLAAVVARTRYPLLAFGCFLFFAGHVLESSIIPLELYFEHRNYLPAVGAILIAGWCVHGLAMRLPWPRLRTAFLVAPVLAVTVLCQMWTIDWSSGLILAQHMAHYHPDSPRAQRLWASALESGGKPGEADQVMARLLARHPGDMGLVLYRVTLNCQYHLQDGVRLDDVINAPILRSNPYLVMSVESLVNVAYPKSCDAAPHESLHRLLDRLENDPLVARHNLVMSRLYFLHGNMYIVDANLDGAVQSLEHAYAEAPSLDVALKRAVVLASAGLYEDALKALAQAQERDRARGWGAPSRGAELALLEQSFRYQLQQQQAKRRSE